MVLLAYSCLMLGIPVLFTWACLTLDGTPWPGRLLYVISLTLFGAFTFLVFRYSPRRRITHLIAGVILVPIMWVVAALIVGAILISPASLDGIH